MGISTVLIVGVQLESVSQAGGGVESDLSHICRWADITKHDDSGWQARSQPQNSKGAPATSKGAHNLHPKKVVTKSPSQPITARGSGGAL